jgi:predicted AlkP superfamily pyrophosphatase or phosphodiesterase
MQRTMVLNLVGVTRNIAQRMPALAGVLSNRGAPVSTIDELIPAVTTTMQATYLTGQTPARHGIVGNGWYDRVDAEVKFWKQSDALVESPRIWTKLKSIDPAFTCANIGWWYAMYSGCDYTVTPRPMYPADGRKIPDCWTHPAGLRDDLQKKFGRFPLFQFWGPMTDIRSTAWLARAAIEIETRFSPTLSLVYLPHLDYALQRLGPGHAEIEKHVNALDGVVGELLGFARRHGLRVVMLSEYGIVPVTRPVHINRALRESGWIAIREELGREQLDAGASEAFAVADHQVAHVYVRDAARVDAVANRLARLPGIARVLVGDDLMRAGLSHRRAGDVVCLAESDAWFTYYHWLDDDRAPDYARTVDIHRKPGYDPCELFLDPTLMFPKLRVARKLLARKLGFRSLLDVIPLEAGLVRGSHGVPVRDAEDGPMLATDAPIELPARLAATDVAGVLMRCLME